MIQFSSLVGLSNNQGAILFPVLQIFPLNELFDAEGCQDNIYLFHFLTLSLLLPIPLIF